MPSSHLDPSSFDRFDLISVEDDSNTLPHDAFFHRLHYLACHQNSIAIRDHQLGIEVPHDRLLSDIVATRNDIIQNLRPVTAQLLREDKEVAFVIFARGYEFVIAFFAILAIGGIAVPTSRSYVPWGLGRC
jgi:malonyl-CoA/methylmalonyl-CoA synthetase